MTLERFKIGKISISITSLPNTLEIIEKAIIENNPGYICVTNTRTTYLANKNGDYCNIQNNSMLTIPDGTPLVWIGHILGYKEIERVSGPQLMLRILTLSQEKGYSHFFFGSTPHVIERINKRLMIDFPSLEVKELISPPFQPIEKFEIDVLADKINATKPTFFWCGLGAPKQEQLMSILQPKLKSTICIGVGLAFEHYAGTVMPPPAIISKLKIEWLFRCFQQPIKARRFIVPFFWMIIELFKNIILKKVFRVKA